MESLVLTCSPKSVPQLCVTLSSREFGGYKANRALATSPQQTSRAFLMWILTPYNTENKTLLPRSKKIHSSIENRVSKLPVPAEFKLFHSCTKFSALQKNCFPGTENLNWCLEPADIFPQCNCGSRVELSCCSAAKSDTSLLDPLAALNLTNPVRKAGLGNWVSALTNREGTVSSMRRAGALPFYFPPLTNRL